MRIILPADWTRARTENNPEQRGAARLPVLSTVHRQVGTNPVLQDNRLLGLRQALRADWLAARQAALALAGAQKARPVGVEFFAATSA